MFVLFAIAIIGLLVGTFALGLTVYVVSQDNS